MAAESERPSCLNGGPGPKGAKESEAASGTAHRLARGNNDMMEIPRPAIQTHGQAMSQVPKLLPTPPIYSAPTSTCNSAVSSRESSPVRISSRPANSPSTSRVSSQTRKGSQDRASPTRTSSNNGHLSGHSLRSSSGGRSSPAPPTKPPQLLSPPPAPEPPANVPSAEKHNMPPWAGNRRAEQETTAPNTSQKRASPSSTEEHGKVDRSIPRAATRGVGGQGPSLETVQEMASNPSTPSSDTALQPTTPDDARLHTIDEDATPRASRHNTESGSDSGGNPSSKEESRIHTPGAAKLPGSIMPQRSSTSLSASARVKPSDGSVRNMIVETETVSSIPQVSLGVGTGERGNASRAEQGTLRMKPSTETIRPRKEKKKNRRANHLTTGPGTSKADIFEAKVASAVDEADVSDSDETFVYESNPPDPYPPRQSRYHSRTPSATSMASQVDQLAGRARGAMRDGSHSVTGKRSMKFTNNPYNSSLDGDAQEADASRNAGRVEGSGTITPRHHVGRHGRNGAYPSLFDNDGPFPQPQTQLKSPRHFIGSGYRHSRNSNTRSSPNYRTIANKKVGDVYDFDAEGADDERTPLVGTPRATRSRHGRRPNSATLRQMEYMAQRERGCFSRYGSCAIILLLLLIIAGGAASFITAATKTLLDVQVVAIQNVLASEQEIMLDLQVEAVNPNIFPVTIDDADVNIFAKSRYVGTENSWQEHSSDEDVYRAPRVEQSRRRWYLSQLVRCMGNAECVEQAMNGHSKGHEDGGVDKGTDPIGDPEGDAQTMLLGRVFRFDSPLSFEASPWGHLVSTSKGQIRLARPGNKTESGGTERWERVLQHPFELIVRGVVKYQLPLSSRFHSASISSTVRVVPNDDDAHNPDSPDSSPPSNGTVPQTSLTRGTTTPPVHLIVESVAQPERQPGETQRQFTS